MQPRPGAAGGDERDGRVMPETERIGVLFVCMGNICRSPMAEGVFRHLVAEAGLGERFAIDSAGIGAWHEGDPPDERASATAAGRGVALTGTARQVRPTDLRDFDYILAMDEENLAALRRLKRLAAPDAEVRLLREFDAEARPDEPLEVPDPYYGGPRGFELVYDMVERSGRGLLAHIRRARRL